jgi:hypothetical protein
VSLVHRYPSEEELAAEPKDARITLPPMDHMAAFAFPSLSAANGRCGCALSSLGGDDEKKNEEEASVWAARPPPRRKRGKDDRRIVNFLIQGVGQFPSSMDGG